MPIEYCPICKDMILFSSASHRCPPAQYEQACVEYSVGCGRETLEVSVFPYQDWHELGILEEELEYKKTLLDDDWSEDPESLEEIQKEIASLPTQIEKLKAKEKIFVVSGETVPEYHAELKRPPKPPNQVTSVEATI